MKKLLKFLGVSALLASVIPYDVKTDGNKKIFTALLWKGTDQPNKETGAKHDLKINVQFNNPFAQEEETHLFADELTVDYGGPAPEAQEDESTEILESPGSAAPAPETVQESDAPAPVAPEEPKTSDTPASQPQDDAAEE